MTLAAHLGESNVDEMLAGMTSLQFAEWQAWYGLEFFGEERADYRMASLACLISNIWRAPGQAQKRVRDFMPRFDIEVEEKPSQRNQFMLWCMMSGKMKKT